MSADLNFIREVECAVANGSVGRRAEILERVTDLFIAGATQLSDDEIALFDDVITRLAVEIEISARALLSFRLAPIPNAPPRTIRTLAFDDAIDVAACAGEVGDRCPDYLSRRHPHVQRRRRNSGTSACSDHDRGCRWGLLA